MAGAIGADRAIGLRADLIQRDDIDAVTATRIKTFGIPTSSSTTQASRRSQPASSARNVSLNYLP